MIGNNGIKAFFKLANFVGTFSTCTNKHCFAVVILWENCGFVPFVLRNFETESENAILYHTFIGKSSRNFGSPDMNAPTGTPTPPTVPTAVLLVVAEPHEQAARFPARLADAQV